MKRKKPSSSLLFTSVCVSIAVLSILIVSAVSFINLRRVSYTQIEALTQENTRRISEGVTSMLAQYTGLLHTTGIGVSALLHEGHPPIQDMYRYLSQNMATLPEIIYLYYTSIVRWNDPGGYAVIYPEWEPTDDWNNTDRPWFTAAMQAQGKVAFSEPYVEFVTGKLVLAMSKIMFDANGKDMGIVIEEITADFLGSIVNANAFMPEQQTFLITHDGLFITNPDESAVMAKDLFTELGLERYRASVLAPAPFSALDDEVFIASSFMPDTNWRLVSVIPTPAILADANRALLQIVIIGIALFVIAALTSLICARIIVKPLRDLTTYSAVVAQGDFSGTVPDYGTAEASGLAAGFNAINEHISALVRNIAASFEQMRDHGKELRRVIDQSSAAAGKIVDAVHDVDARIKEESGMVDKTVAKIDDKIVALNTLIQEQAAQIRSSSSVIETTIAYNREMQAQISALNGRILQVVDSSKSEHEQIARSTKAVRQIGEDSKDLAEMNKTIDGVAAQTNLLAMNAAIEAAHAGVVGKMVKSTEQVFAASQQAHGSVEENGKGLNALDGAIQRFTVRKV